MKGPKLRIIHINQHHIKANAKDNGNRPVITVKQGTKNFYGHEAHTQGPCKVVYNQEKPLSCGARVWIETERPVLIRDRVKNKTRLI